MVSALQWIKKNKHLSALFFTAVVGGVFLLFPTIAGFFYRRFLFQVFRVSWDYTLGFLPFPKIILLLVFALSLLAIIVWRNRKNLRQMGLSLLRFLNVVLLLFFWMWGFNYCCPDLLHQSREPEMKENDYFIMGLSTADQCKQSRPQIKNDEIEKHNFSEDEIRSAVETFLFLQKWPVRGRVRCHGANSFSLMRKMGISGIYIPLTGEGYTSSTFPAVSRVFIMAHEMAHGYGITGEGEADFVAYMALSSYTGEAGNYFKYAAELELLRSVRSNLRILNRSLREMLIESTDSIVNADIELIRQNHLAFKEYFPGTGEKVNDTYLKFMGVNDGVKNYDRFAEMVWRARLNEQ